VPHKQFGRSMATPMYNVSSVFQFLRAVIRHWGALVSGGAIIGFLGIWQGTGHPVSPTVYWIVAIVEIFVACYLTWNEERVATEKALRDYEAEVSKNRKPDLRGMARNFKQSGMCGDRREGDQLQAAFRISFDLSLCNHQPIPTDLHDIQISGTLLSKVVGVFTLDFERRRPLDYGIAVDLPVSVVVTLDGVSLADVRRQEIGLDGLRIYAVSAMLIRSQSRKARQFGSIDAMKSGYVEGRVAHSSPVLA
jgi:hypothetical protein